MPLVIEIRKNYESEKSIKQYENVIHMYVTSKWHQKENKNNKE